MATTDAYLLDPTDPDTTVPLQLAKALFKILECDAERLERIDHYLHGHHDNPYMPQNADAEYRLLAKRAVSNWMPLIVDTPAQALYVDSFRPSSRAVVEVKSPEWDHWQYSRMDARQMAVHRGALAYGHSFTVTEKDDKDRVVTKGLSAMRTAALYEDAANDCTPYAALTVTEWPVGEEYGEARFWDETNVHLVAFKSVSDPDSVVIAPGVPHGSAECPVTRFAAAIDLEGRTCGVVEPMIALQNRINQTVFDLLVAQTYGSFKVRYVTGMAPPVKRDPESGEIEFDETGNPQPLPIDHNARRFLFAEDPDVKFGSLDETPLGGFIESIDMSIRHLAAISQVPPHHLLGQIANLSAEALQAAETSLSRKVQEFQALFGESWERVFRLAGELAGETGAATDFGGEVIWRDMESRSLAQSADALGKMSQLLGVPQRGLWPRVPGVTKNELDTWDKLKEEEDPQLALTGALTRATNPGLPKPSLGTPPNAAKTA